MCGLDSTEHYRHVMSCYQPGLVFWSHAVGSWFFGGTAEENSLQPRYLPNVTEMQSINDFVK